MSIEDARAASEYENDNWANDPDPLMLWPDMQATLDFWIWEAEMDIADFLRFGGQVARKGQLSTHGTPFRRRGQIGAI